MEKDYPIKLAGQIWADKVYTCIFCGEQVRGFDDKLSAQEYRISGMCQNCQDETFE